MESQTIIGMVGAFIALAIMLSLGTIILGGAVADCSDLPGAPTNAALANQPGSYTLTDAGDVPTNTAGVADSWGHQCAKNSANSQSSYSLLMIALIIMAAAIVLLVVRFLSG